MHDHARLTNWVGWYTMAAVCMRRFVHCRVAHHSTLHPAIAVLLIVYRGNGAPVAILRDPSVPIGVDREQLVQPCGWGPRVTYAMISALDSGRALG